MIIRRYTGSSLEGIREAIERELGPNAVIVNTEKKTKMGLLPGLRKVTYEVITAVEETAHSASRAAGPDQTAPDNMVEWVLEEQKQQYRNLRQSIKMLDAKLADVDSQIETMRSVPDEEHPRPVQNVHESWRPRLLELARMIAGDAEPEAQHFHTALSTMISTRHGLDFQKCNGSGPAVCVVVGPTGVGKTTSIAKLAASCVLKDKLNVGLLTIDTFRVAAVDQLREYARLIGVEFSVAFSAKELDQYIQRFQNKDVIFIDTPGRSQFDESGIGDIREYLDNPDRYSVILTVPANVRREDAEHIVRSYQRMAPSSLIISKTDEASCCDGLTHLLNTSGLPIAYLTDGQRVPEDIHLAAPGIVASLVIPDLSHHEHIKSGIESYAR